MAVSPVAGLNSKLSLPSGKQQHSKFTGQSVRAIPIRILTVGKNRSQGVQLIVDEYMKKLRNYCSVDDVRIKSNPKNARDVVAQIEHEDIAVMGLIKPDEWVSVQKYLENKNYPLTVVIYLKPGCNVG
uniref:RNA methyltransferase n=1 Tax=Solanum tuberosum TaxID=4113 RepID=M1CUW1_SOLTU